MEKGKWFAQTEKREKREKRESERSERERKKERKKEREREREREREGERERERERDLFSNLLQLNQRAGDGGEGLAVRRVRAEVLAARKKERGKRVNDSFGKLATETHINTTLIFLFDFYFPLYELTLV